MRTYKMLIFTFQIGCALTLAFSHAGATEMVYTPLNPSFGGNANNGVIFLSEAQAQNGHKDPSIVTAAALTDLQQFNQSLQRSVLSPFDPLP